MRDLSSAENTCPMRRPIFSLRPIATEVASLPGKSDASVGFFLSREADPTAILEALRDKDNVDPSHRIMMVEGGKAYNPALLATEHSAAESAAHARS